MNPVSGVQYFVQDGKWNYYTQDANTPFSLFQVTPKASMKVPTTAAWRQCDGRTVDLNTGRAYSDVRFMVPSDFSDSVQVHVFAIGSGSSFWSANATIADGWSSNPWVPTAASTTGESCAFELLSDGNSQPAHNGIVINPIVSLRSGMLSVYWTTASVNSTSDYIECNFMLEGYRNTLYGEDL